MILFKTKLFGHIGLQGKGEVIVLLLCHKMQTTAYLQEKIVPDTDIFRLLWREQPFPNQIPEIIAVVFYFCDPHHGMHVAQTTYPLLKIGFK